MSGTRPLRLEILTPEESSYTLSACILTAEASLRSHATSEITLESILVRDLSSAASATSISHRVETWVVT